MKAAPNIFFQGDNTPYRWKFYEKLGQKLDGNLTIIYGDKISIDYREAVEETPQFYHVERNIEKKLRIPFTSRYLSFQAKTIGALLGSKYSVLLLGLRMTRLDVWLALLLNLFIRKRIILWGHGFNPTEKHFVWLKILFLRMASCCVLFTNERRDIAAGYGYPTSRIFVAPNTIDTEKVFKIRESLCHDDLTDFLQYNGLEGKKYILYFGRLLDYKRPEMLLEVLEHVLKEVPSFMIVYIGYGHMMEPLKRKVEQYGYQRHVKFAGGIFDERILGCYFQNAIATVLPTKSGLAIQHSFCYGTPFITNGNRSMHGPEVELLIDHKTALIFKENDICDLADKILELIKDGNLRKQLSCECEKLMREVYTVDNMAQGYLNAIIDQQRNNLQ